MTILSDDWQLILTYSDGSVETRPVPTAATLVTTTQPAILYWFLNVYTDDPASTQNRRYQALWALPSVDRLGNEYANAGYLLSPSDNNTIRIDADYDGVYEQILTLNAGEMYPSSYLRRPSPHYGLEGVSQGHVQTTHPVLAWQIRAGAWYGTDDHIGGTEQHPFYPTPTLYSISGHVRDDSGNPILDAVVSAGAGGSATTDANGVYSITELFTGTYTLTPIKSGYIFSPSTRTVNVPPSQTGQDFTGTTYPDDPLFPQQWGLHKIEIANAWSYSHSASDVVIAVIDTGVGYTHVDLGSGKTLTDGDKDYVNDDNDAMDDEGHFGGIWIAFAKLSARNHLEPGLV